jgi:histidinol phosphatase-like PHP family hydrolase
LNVQLLKLARDHGTRISLGTDAHHPWQLEFIQLGLAAVLTARVPPQQIVNFMPIPNLKDWIEQVRARSARRPKSTDRRSRPRT